MNDTFSISKEYELNLDIETKKNNGVYYTPKVIVDYIINKTIKNHNIIKNPSPKILDIYCGCGNFLLEAYDTLYKLFEDNIEKLKENYNSDYWRIDNIHNHIISNCLYGADIDNLAIDILRNQLINKDKYAYIDKFNIYCCDSLKKKWEEKFDYVIGNPPYVGHKRIDIEYKKFIFKEYKEVYKGKSDLYYCFYKKIIDILNEDGIASVITPRYFLESPSGKYIRNYIDKNVSIEEIIDFLGATIFNNVGISSCIMTFKNKKQINKDIRVLRIKDESIDINKIDSIENLIDSKKFKHFILDKDSLDEEWIIINKQEESFYKQIQNKCEYTLEDICTSFQGIITGCDKAFVVKKDNECVHKIDEKLLKPWVKNTNIDRYVVRDSNYNLIYSNDIKSEKIHKYVIDEFISKYKDKLENRRECKKNIRKWYELQWGREKSYFERVKIMYPYKASQNRFAIDYNDNFCSADVYSFYINNDYINEFSYEYIVGLLNSSIYDRYFKIKAKKISKNLYDYYPNKVMKIKIFKDHNYDAIEKLSKEILFNLKNNKHNLIQDLERKIDNLIIQSLQL